MTDDLSGRMRPEGWDDLSLWEQIALLPEDEQETAILDLVRRGVDLNSYEVLLRPKQKMIVESDEPIIIFQAGRGCGKLLALDTPVPVPDGWTTMGALQVGDVVLDEQGEPTKVLAVYDDEPERAWRLHFSDGEQVVAGGEHQWVTWTHRDRKSYQRYDSPGEFPEDWTNWSRDHYFANNVNGESYRREIEPPVGPRIRTTDEIVETLRYGSRGDLNHCIPLAKPMQLPDVVLPLDPWLLGFWLGNGSSSSAQIIAGSKDGDFDVEHVVGCVAAAGFDCSRRDYPEKGQSVIGVRDFLGTLRGMGLLHNKHIPSQYLRAGETQRLALLRGLCDSDGYADPRANGRVEFCSSDEALARDVLELARTLGEKPILAEGRATLDGRDMGLKYRVTWTPVQHNPFALPRKASLVDTTPRAQGLRLRHRMITDITPAPIQPMRCITVDSPNSMYLIGEGMIPTHNTFTGSAWVNTYAKEHPGCRIALIGRTVADVRDTMVQGDSGIINTAPKDFVPTYTPSIRHLEWPNGSTATTYAAVVPDLMRGPQQDAAWCDELAAYPTKPDSSGATMWDNIVMATRLGDNPQILATTTPKRVPLMHKLKAMADNGEGVKIVTGTSWENRSNLSKQYMDQVFNKYAGTYLERQELYGELIGDSEDAIWNSQMIQYEDMPEDEELLFVIGVDPAVTVGNDDTGIVVVACDLNPDPYKRRAWVVDDYTMNDHVEVWAKTVLEVQMKWSQVSPNNPKGRPAMVVVEKDHGHDLLGVLFKNAGADLNTTPIIPISTRGQGKVQRAESVVLAYQQGRVKHDKELPGLETEMTGWEPRNSKGISPGHIDALVHALRVLLVDSKPIARWAPVITSERVDYGRQSLAGVRPAWKREQGISEGGLSVAAWRR